MVDYNIYDIYNIKQLEFRLDMKIECVHIYIYSNFFPPFFPCQAGYLGSCSEPLLRRGKHTGILELVFAF